MSFGRLTFLFILLWLSPLPIFAEVLRGVSKGFGYTAVEPSVALSTNPAGLVYTAGTKVQGLAASGGTSNPGIGAGLVTGSEKIGLGLVYREFGLPKDSPGNLGLLNWGLAVTLDQWNTAIGIGGSKMIKRLDPPIQDDEVCSNFCGDFGFIVNPNGDLRFSGILQQLNDGKHVLGAGIATAISANVEIGADFQHNPKDGNLVGTPFFGFLVDSLEISLGNSFRINGQTENVLREGFNAGVSLKILEGMRLSFYHNIMAQYLFNLAWDI